MPVFWFSLSQLSTFNSEKAFLVFVILHLFLYPASNAYNSYFDKDEGSIGGIESPPPVEKELYYTALIFDFIAIFMSLFLINYKFAISVFVYGLFSRAYSHTKIRIKKYPILSWLIVGFFQGFWIYLAVFQALNLNELSLKDYFAGFLSSILLWALYPMTQIYQHEEDAKRGDETLSRKLGINGTFIFTGIVFLIGLIGFYFYFEAKDFLYFIVFSFPITLYFLLWFWQVMKSNEQVNFKKTMILNFLASLCMNVFYIFLLIQNN